MTPFLVLIVDDDPDARVILRTILQVRGFRTMEARDGRQGVALASDHAPDAILMDISMSGMDGFDAARRIRGDPAVGSIPIVAVTGRDLSGPEVEDADRLFDAFYRKPLAVRPFVNHLLDLVDRIPAR